VKKQLLDDLQHWNQQMKWLWYRHRRKWHSQYPVTNSLVKGHRSVTKTKHNYFILNIS